MNPEDTPVEIVDAINAIIPFCSYNPFPHGTLIHAYWNKRMAELEASLTENGEGEDES